MKLKHDTITSLSIDGTEYLADEKSGLFDMPEEAAVIAVRDWGFASPPAKGAKGKEPANPKSEGSSAGDAAGSDAAAADAAAGADQSAADQGQDKPAV